MLSTIINALMESQEISVSLRNGAEPVYTGEASQFFNETHGLYTNYIAFSIFTIPLVDVIYIHIDEE